MTSQLQEKVAIVTGSSSGIGEAIAVMFASRGARVTLCGRDQGRLKSVLDKVVKVSGGHQDRFITVQGDANDAQVRKEISDKTVETFGSLDVLVANAGVSTVLQTVQTVTEDSYNKVMDTNLKSVFFLIQQALPYLETSKGNIINISSIASFMVVPSVTVYSLSKAALDHLTRCLAVDLGPKGIRVNSVHPGYISSNLGREFGEKHDKIAEAMAKLDRANQPLNYRLLTVEDVAETVSFLASDAASFITGEHIRVDGGRSYGGPFDE